MKVDQISIKKIVKSREFLEDNVSGGAAHKMIDVV
jgi:hypothetical protein